LVRDRGMIRTSTTSLTSCGLNKSTNSPTGRVECPIVKNRRAMFKPFVGLRRPCVPPSIVWFTPAFAHFKNCEASLSTFLRPTDRLSRSKTDQRTSDRAQDWNTVMALRLFRKNKLNSSNTRIRVIDKFHVRSESDDRIRRDIIRRDVRALDLFAKKASSLDVHRR